MNKKYKKHVFVCTNERKNSNRQSCGTVGSELRLELKRQIADRGLSSDIRINSSGCLGKCSQGPCLVTYPESDWKFNINIEKCDNIVEDIIED